MRAQTLVTLVILFQTLFSLSSTQQTAPVSAGTLNACPQIPPVPFANVRCAAPAECADSSCQSGERCCPTTPCGAQRCTNVGFTTDPNNPKPQAPPKPRLRPVRPLGDCPAVPDTPLMCTAVVMPPCDQSKCGNNQKCCFNGCHTVCTSVVPKPRPHVTRPRPVPTGCPAIPPTDGPRMCTQVFVPPCEQSKCGQNEKCCSDGCHTRCTKVESQVTLPVLPPAPVLLPLPTGECPAIPPTDGPRMCTQVFLPPCEQSKCGANEKCCSDGCHTRCTKVESQVTLPVLPPAPVLAPVPTGECPAIPPTDGPRMCTKIFLPPCEQSNCGANEKCCFDGCHTRCTKVESQVTLPVLPTAPVLPVPTGACPAIPPTDGPRMCTRIFLPPCEQSKCGANEKCCFDGCHTRCTKVDGQVTLPVLPPTPIRKPVPTGACPAIPPTDGPRMCTKIFLPPCEQTNCGVNEKCCFDGCHTRCTKVVLPPKPRVGQCPPAPKGLMCTAVMRPPCVESQCAPNQKCCSNGCFSTCTAVSTDMAFAIAGDSEIQQEGQQMTQTPKTESTPTWAIVLLAIGAIIIVVTVVVIVQIQLVFSRKQLRY